MLFLWAVTHTKLFQVAVRIRQQALRGKKRWMGDSQTDIWRGGVSAKGQRREILNAQLESEKEK